MYDRMIFTRHDKNLIEEVKIDNVFTRHEKMVWNEESKY